MKKARPFTVTGLLFASAAMLGATVAQAEGNRYDLERHYHSDISAAKAYVLTHASPGSNGTNGSNGNYGESAVIIDVRTIEEYIAGHPRRAYNIPFPHIQARPANANYIGQDPEQFVHDVKMAFPDKATPILLLCRTGYRSVLAGNLLAEAGYTNVRNIWEGFVGVEKVDTAGNVLDVNNDGIIDDRDRDGWGGFLGLPYTTQLLPNRIYATYAHLYYE